MCLIKMLKTAYSQKFSIFIGLQQVNMKIKITNFTLHDQTKIT